MIKVLLDRRNRTEIMKNSTRLASAVFAVCASGYLGSSANAQEPTPQKWFKVCGKQAENDVCNTQFQVVASNGQVITSVNLFDVKGKNTQRLFQITVPTNRLIPAGVVVKVDDKKDVRIPYNNCFRDRCTANAALDDNLVKLLKSGGKMVLTSVNYQNKPNPITVSLNGFTAAYDGPPLKKPDVDAQNRKLQEELQKKAEEARKKLEEAQQKATE